MVCSDVPVLVPTVVRRCEKCILSLSLNYLCRLGFLFRLRAVESYIIQLKRSLIHWKQQRQQLVLSLGVKWQMLSWLVPHELVNRQLLTLRWSLNRVEISKFSNCSSCLRILEFNSFQLSEGSSIKCVE